MTKKLLKNSAFCFLSKFAENLSDPPFLAFFKTKTFLIFFQREKQKLTFSPIKEKKGWIQYSPAVAVAPLLTYSTLLLIRCVLSVLLFLRLRAFFVGRLKRRCFWVKRIAARAAVLLPPGLTYTRPPGFFLSLSFLKKMRLSLKNGRNPPFFDCKKGVNFILFLLTDVSFFRTMKISRGEKNPATESVGTKKE